MTVDPLKTAPYALTRLPLVSVLVLVACVPVAASSRPSPAATESEAGWTYPEMTGTTNNWVAASPAYAACGGPLQSPINVTRAGSVRSAATVTVPPANMAVPIQRKEPAWEAGHHNFGFVIPSGAPPAVTIADKNTGITTNWTVKEYHFHVAAEHNDACANNPNDACTQYPMELHMVSADPNGALGVFGVRLNAAPSGDPALLSAVLASAQGGSPATGFPIGAALAGFGTGSFFAYRGSLTTPDCSIGKNGNGLQWHVLEKSVGVNATQLESWVTLVSQTFHTPGNARVGPKSQPVVTLYNAL